MNDSFLSSFQDRGYKFEGLKDDLHEFHEQNLKKNKGNSDVLKECRVKILG